MPKFPLDSPNVLRESLNNRPQLAAVPIPLNPGRGVSLAEDLRTQTDYDEVDRSCSDQKEEMTQWTSFQWLATSILILNDHHQSLISVLPGYTKWRTNTYCFVWPVDTIHIVFGLTCLYVLLHCHKVPSKGFRNLVLINELPGFCRSWILVWYFSKVLISFKHTS